MHAAGAILGSTEAYAKVPFFWTRQYETSIKYIGYLEANVRSVVRGSVEDRDGLVGYFDGDRLIGAASLGRSTELLAVERLMASGEPVSSEDFEKGEL
jgi:3-phenylpropionate/trans-cinnamate dioxygenase ferredoxin reductase subunit